jgi:DNA-binding beta-propeller fold protein YncE
MLASLCCAALLPAMAAAQPGSVHFRGCISQLGGGCAALPAGSLVGTAGIAVSPDGRSVYATSYGGDTVNAFGRAAGGGLGFQGCIATGGVGGCQAAPGDSLRGAAGVAVSPSGADVYVVSGLARSVTRLSRAADGQLGFGACIGEAEGCEPLGSGLLAGATGIALGPGGSDVYIASTDSGTLTRFARTADGGLELRQCFSGGGVPGCRSLPGNSLGGASSVAVSADGRDLFVASYASAAVVRFRRGADGGLAYRGCIADGGANRCRKLPFGSLSGAAGIAASRSGDLFVAAQVGTVTRLRADRPRGLTFAGCVSDGASKGCARATGSPLAQATGIAVSPDGGDVYVAAQEGNSLVHLRPRRRNELLFAGCLAARRAHRCGRVPAPALRGAYALAIVPAGNVLYVAAARGRAISAFSRR